MRAREKFVKILMMDMMGSTSFNSHPSSSPWYDTDNASARNCNETTIRSILRSRTFLLFDNGPKLSLVKP